MIGIIDMMGGFGNQLFQYGIGMFLKEQGLKVYIYESNKESENRRIVIPESDFGFDKIGKRHLFFINLLKNTNYLKEYYGIVNDSVLSGPEQVINIKKSSKRVVSFNGFWQKKIFVDEYFDNIKKIILDNKAIKASNTTKKEGSTMVHVRRTDYKNNKEVLKSDYYKNSLEHCKKNIKNFNYSIFTDDYDWARSQKIFEDAVDINVPKNQLNYRNEVLSTFGKMLSFENYVIANSTFSWWAARISSTENSKVLYPNPFFKDESFDAFYGNWTPIER